MAKPSPNHHQTHAQEAHTNAQGLLVLKTKEQLNGIIINKNGKPDFCAINIYWDSLRSWYAPLEVYHPNGNITQHRKLKTKGVYYSAEKLAKIHGVSKETIRKKLVKLERLVLIQRNFHHKETVTTKSYNRREIFVWKHTPYFFNSYGIEIAGIGLLKAQTNAKYVENKHNVVFGSQSQAIKDIEAKGGIHTPEDTKELRESFNKLKDRSNESNIFQISKNTIISSDTNNSVEASVEKIVPVTATKAVIRQFNKTPQNQRKKVINSDKKARLYHFRQYAKPKTLSDMEAITQAECLDIQLKSGREFNLNAQNEMLKDIAKKLYRTFHSRAQFLAYFSKCMLYEKRNAVSINNINFKITARMNEIEKEKHTTQQERENCMKDTEDAGIWNRGDYTQFRAKIAGQFPINLAYNLLINMLSAKKKENALEFTMYKHVELTEHFQALLLQLTNAVGGYCGVDKLEFVIKKIGYDKT